MKKKAIEDSKLLQLLESVPKDAVEIFILRRGSFRGALVNGTHMVNQMRANHELGVLESFILGHGYLAGSLLASNLKGQDRIGMDLQCSGEAQRISVEAAADGMVRGYIQNREISVDTPLETFDMSPFIGEGVLSVTKYQERAKQPFTGSVSLEYGNIAQDLALYFMRSEQKPTAVNLSVQFDSHGRIIGAGGLMMQAFPGTEDESSAALDSKVRNFPSIGTELAGGTAPEALVEQQLSEFDPVSIGQREVEFRCPCSKERFSRYLAALPIEEIRDIRDNGPFPLRTTCHNCNSTYEFSEEEVE